jgi:hypothetical protein
MYYCQSGTSGYSFARALLRPGCRARHCAGRWRCRRPWPRSRRLQPDNQADSQWLPRHHSRRPRTAGPLHRRAELDLSCNWGRNGCAACEGTCKSGARLPISFGSERLEQQHAGNSSMPRCQSCAGAPEYFCPWPFEKRTWALAWWSFVAHGRNAVAEMIRGNLLHFDGSPHRRNTNGLGYRARGHRRARGAGHRISVFNPDQAAETQPRFSFLTLRTLDQKRSRGTWRA